MSKLSNKIDNKKPFEIFADKWAKTLPPSRPGRSELKLYQKLFVQYKNKRSQTKILILGATPELRDLFSQFDSEVTIADANVEMVKAMSLLRRYQTKEKIIIGRWEKLPLRYKYDIVMGDISLNMLDKAAIPKMVKRVARMLKDGGYFLHRTATYNPGRRVNIIELISNWRQNKIDIGDFRLLTELYSEYRSYNPSTQIDSKTILFKNFQKLYSAGLLTNAEYQRLHIYNDNVKIVILTKTEWRKLFLQHFKVINVAMPHGHLFCQDLPIFVCQKK